MSYLILIFLFSCEESIKEKDLRDTVWQKNRVEIYDTDNQLVQVFEPEPCELLELIKFGNDERILRTNNCNSLSPVAECGTWYMDKGKLNVVLGIDLFVKDFCELISYQTHVVYYEVEISFDEEILVLETAGIDDHRLYLSEEIQEKLKNGEYLGKAFYNRSQGNVVPTEDNVCCK